MKQIFFFLKSRIMDNLKIKTMAERNIENRSNFYWVIGVIAAILVIIGFTRTFFLRAWFDIYPLSWLAKAHGISMMSWFALFIIQSVLIKKDNVKLHKRLGVLGVLLIPVILFIGIPNMIIGARLGHSPIPAVPFMAISVVLFFQFGLLSVLGLVNRHKPDLHKRLIVLSIISTLAPAFTRMPFKFLFVGFPVSIIIWSNLLIFACWIYDWKKNGKIHRVYIWGGIFLVLLQLFSLALAASDIWGEIANWLLKL